MVTGQNQKKKLSEHAIKYFLAYNYFIRKKGKTPGVF